MIGILCWDGAVGFVRLGLAVVLFLGCFLSMAHAQADDSAQADEAQLPPTDYGAGYKVTIFYPHQEHESGPGYDQDEPGPVKLDITHPLIASPLTPEADTFNTKMQQMVANGGPDRVIYNGIRSGFRFFT
jgi:hypothetical protein